MYTNLKFQHNVKITHLSISMQYNKWLKRENNIRVFWQACSYKIRQFQTVNKLYLNLCQINFKWLRSNETYTHKRSCSEYDVTIKNGF